MPGGNLPFDFLDALVDELTREIDVRAVLEDDGHLRQAVARERTGVFEMRQAAHRGLDGEGDALLGFQRRVAGRLRVDLHLDVGDVRHGVDRETLVIVNAQRGDGRRGDEDEPALANGKIDECSSISQRGSGPQTHETH